MRQLLLLLLLLAGGLPAADAPYLTWHLDLGDGVRAVATSRGERIHRIVLAWTKRSGTAHYSGHGEAPHLDQLQVPAAARELVAAPGEGLHATGRLLLFDRKAIGGGKDFADSVAIELALTVGADGRIAGSVKLDGQALTAAGHRLDPARAAQSNALPVEVAWPNWSGPHGDGSAMTGPQPPAMIAHAKDARLRWISEDVMPFMSAGPRFRYGPNGGCATPIVHQGRLYQWYYVPAGEAIDAGRATQGRDPTPEPWNRHLADDVMVCMDAATGATLWRTVAPLSGLTYPCHKNESQGHVMAARDDRVFAVGAAGRVFCLDAATGAIVWQVDSPLDGQLLAQAAAHREKRPRPDRSGPPSNRGSGHSPVVAGGTLVVSPSSGNGTGIAGIAIADGQVLWQRNGIQETCASPLVWRVGGTESVIVTGPSDEKTGQPATVRCLDAATGEDRWAIDGLGPMPYGASLHGDLLFVNIGTASRGPAARVAAYRLAANGAERLWALPEGAGGTFTMYPGSGAMMVDGAVQIRHMPAADGFGSDPGATMEVYGKPAPADNGLLVVDAATGALKARRLLWNGLNEGALIGHPGLLVWFREYQHGHTAPDLLDPVTAAHRGVFAPAVFLTSTGYQVPATPPMADGRIYLRGSTGIWCYDLRAAPR